MQNFITPIPLSLYIHIPWCVRKCPYCDFNSHTAQRELPEKEYVDALLSDLDQNLTSLKERPLTSIFFGGGTPSLFSPESIEKILLGIESRMNKNSSLEITLEANPGTVDEAHFVGFRQAGINRLSLGIQSLQNEKLQALGRIHGEEQAKQAIETAKRAGFKNFNLDLMHGLPNQSPEDALSDLKVALSYEPTHLSWYQLTIEPNTFFAIKPPKLPIEETLWEIQELGKNLLAEKNFLSYEVSAYSLPKNACRHNLNYWEFGDYLGIGAGAHSKITDIERQRITRHWQIKNPKDYLDASKRSIKPSVISEEDTIFEFMLNALRLTRGFSADLFNERTGLPIQSIEKLIAKATHKKLLTFENNIFCPTDLGQRFLNDLIGIFLTSGNASC